MSWRWSFGGRPLSCINKIHDATLTTQFVPKTVQPPPPWPHVTAPHKLSYYYYYYYYDHHDHHHNQDCYDNQYHHFRFLLNWPIFQLLHVKLTMSVSMSKTFIVGAVCREFESEAPAAEEMLDRVVCSSEQFCFQICLEGGDGSGTFCRWRQSSRQLVQRYRKPWIECSQEGNPLNQVYLENDHAPGKWKWTFDNNWSRTSFTGQMPLLQGCICRGEWGVRVVQPPFTK